jgi:hypothetical protein
VKYPNTLAQGEGFFSDYRVVFIPDFSSDGRRAHSRGRGRNPLFVGLIWAGAEGAAEVAGHPLKVFMALGQER